jgi:hypothetical protein
MDADRVPIPRNLSGRGRRFYVTVTEKYRLRPDELELLLEACRVLTLVDTLHGECQAAPLLTEGYRGAPRPNPLLLELRQQREVLRGLLRALKLPDPPAARGTSTRQRAASHAARARWGSSDG